MQESGREEQAHAPETLTQRTREAPDAFRDAYLQFAPMLRKIAMKKFRVPPSDAEALVHDVFTTYFTNAGEVHVVESYLIGAICNASRHYWRRSDAANALFCPESPCAGTPTDAIVEEVARKRLLSKVLARVGSRCRDLMYRYYLNGETTRDIAEALEIKPSTVHVFLSKCRKRALSAYRALMEPA
jgi:RNA polymerase sigma factor (sigma-70 family)